MDIDYYVQKLKEHEENRTSTNNRNAYWKQRNETMAQTDMEMVEPAVYSRGHAPWQGV